MKIDIESVISNALHEAQQTMPDGQIYNLYSKSACDMLARKCHEAIVEYSSRTDIEKELDATEQSFVGQPDGTDLYI